jgi:hypothetical protein
MSKQKHKIANFQTLNFTANLHMVLVKQHMYNIYSAIHCAKHGADDQGRLILKYGTVLLYETKLET